jgi:hypothetical protein
MPSFQIITHGRMTPPPRDATGRHRDSAAYLNEAARQAIERIDRALAGDLAHAPCPSLGREQHRAGSHVETYERYHPGARIVGIS